ncbi:unnamed protein product [Ectocarpus fasciculatus]
MDLADVTHFLGVFRHATKCSKLNGRFALDGPGAGDAPTKHRSPCQTSIPDIPTHLFSFCSDGANLREVTLAKSLLGSDALVCVSASHGVELELQAGSLVEDVHHPVTVSPRLQIVTCRTEGSVRAPSHEASHDEEFLAMTFVRGPEEASFLDEKPAKLRFFVGYVDEFVPEDGSDGVLDNEGIKKYVLETYKPLTSPNGVENWTVLGQYTVLFPPPVLGEPEVWVETDLHHFCFLANAMILAEKGLAEIKTQNHSYLYQDVASGWRRRVKDHPRVPTFCIGNATESTAVFLYYPIVNFTEASKESEGNVTGEASAGGIGGRFGHGKRNQSSATGGDRAAAMEEIPVVLGPGKYTVCDMAYGVKEHPQMHIRIGVLEDMTGVGSKAKGKFQLLDLKKIGGNKVLVLRQPRLTEAIMYEEVDWPCAAKDIREISGPRKGSDGRRENGTESDGRREPGTESDGRREPGTEGDGRRENGYWKLPSPVWICASLAFGVLVSPAIVSFLSPVIWGFAKSEAVENDP